VTRDTLRASDSPAERTGHPLQENSKFVQTTPSFEDQVFTLLSFGGRRQKRWLPFLRYADAGCPTYLVLLVLGKSSFMKKLLVDPLNPLRQMKRETSDAGITHRSFLKTDLGPTTGSKEAVQANAAVLIKGCC
jgi:hypothetical protein